MDINSLYTTHDSCLYHAVIFFSGCKPPVTLRHKSVQYVLALGQDFPIQILKIYVRPPLLWIWQFIANAPAITVKNVSYLTFSDKRYINI